MGSIKIILSDELEKKFREEVFKRFGMKKGNITKAIKEAVILWLYSDARTEREARMPAWKCRTLSAQSYGEEKT